MFSNNSLTKTHRRLLLDVAAASIQHGLVHRHPLPVKPDDYPFELKRPCATFVTLEKGGRLRGCIGNLEAVTPLIRDIARNAFAAAFKDPRFPPLAPEETEGLAIHLSLLTPAQEMRFESEADLIRQLRPGIDGLILQEGDRRGTFLPSVWPSLPEPRRFFRHLKLKAGLPESYWSQTLEVYRYTTERIE